MSSPESGLSGPADPRLGDLAATAASAHEARRAADLAALEAERRYVVAAAQATESGNLEWHELLDVYDQTRTWGLPGWQQRWHDTVGMTHHEVRRFADALPATRRRPVEYPPFGQYVVYFLFDADEQLLYVGTSCDTRQRLAQHHGKGWTAASIREVHGRTAAEGLEAVEILHHRPPLNEQLHRSGGPGVLAKALGRAGLLTPDRDRAARSIEVELRQNGGRS